MSVTQKQLEEVDLASRLLDALGYRDIAITSSDRPDVLALVGDLCVGIEVTQFHADETTESKGSLTRATEERTAKQLPGQPYAIWSTLDPNPALVARITDKIAAAAAYDTTRYSQLWLLIATGVPKPGAVGATMAHPLLLNIENLDASTHELLRDSPFSAAYVHMHLPSALFCWSRASGWHVR